MTQEEYNKDIESRLEGMTFEEAKNFVGLKLKNNEAAIINEFSKKEIRRQIATAAMQSLIYSMPERNRHRVAEDAVQYADALMEILSS